MPQGAKKERIGFAASRRPDPVRFFGIIGVFRHFLGRGLIASRGLTRSLGRFSTQGEGAVGAFPSFRRRANLPFLILQAFGSSVHALYDRGTQRALTQHASKKKERKFAFRRVGRLSASPRLKPQIVGAHPHRDIKIAAW